MKPERLSDWKRIRDLALGLGLPGVEATTSWGQPTLKAYGKLWVWWSPHEDAPVFKVPVEEREILIEAEPDRFFVTPHYLGHPMVWCGRRGSTSTGRGTTSSASGANRRRSAC